MYHPIMYCLADSLDGFTHASLISLTKLLDSKEEVVSYISLAFPAVPGITSSKFEFNERSNRIKGKNLY